MAERSQYSSDETEVFFERVKKKFNESGLSMKEFARRVGITEYSAERIVTGQRMPRGRILNYIAMVLDCSVGYLMGTEEETDGEKKKL